MYTIGQLAVLIRLQGGEVVGFIYLQLRPRVTQFLYRVNKETIKKSYFSLHDFFSVVILSEFQDDALREEPRGKYESG